MSEFNFAEAASKLAETKAVPQEAKDYLRGFENGANFVGQEVLKTVLVVSEAGGES